MSRTARYRTALAALVVPLIVAAFASPVWAQAWLPGKGEGTVSFLYQDMFVRYHEFPGIGRVDNGQITSQSLLIDVTYGVTDRLAVTFGIPWIASRYSGTNGHPLVDLSGPIAKYSGVNPLDDGNWHGTFQDFRFDLRYNVVAKKGMALTPFVTSTTPSHDYTAFAHAAPGQDLRLLQLGTSGAKVLDRVVPGLFVQGRYAYGIAEQVVDISHNRSNADLEVGYFVTPRMRLLLLGTGQLTHGGIDNRPNGRVTLGALYPYHDQITRINFLDVGGGASYTLTDNIDLFGSLIRTVAARNGHIIDHGLSLGLSWGFSTRRARDRAIASADRSLVKCQCAKSAS
jgi:hypothetical protein